MGKLQFLLRCVKDMDYAELFRTVGKVHKLTGKNSGRHLDGCDPVRPEVRRGLQRLPAV